MGYKESVSEENEIQNTVTLEKNTSPEEITEQLKELTKQLNYKEKYEKEQEKLMEQYKQNLDSHKQLMEQSKQNADTYKQLLEEERLRNKDTAKQIEIINKENMQRLFEKLKTEMTKTLTVSEEVYKTEMLEKVRLMNEENLKQKVVIDELKEEITQLKNQLAAYEKQCEGHANYCKELNEISEKRINEAMDKFNQQIKDTGEVCRNLKLLQHTRPIEDSSNAAAKTNYMHDVQSEKAPQLEPQKGLSNL